MCPEKQINLLEYKYFCQQSNKLNQRSCVHRDKDTITLSVTTEQPEKSTRTKLRFLEIVTLKGTALTDGTLGGSRTPTVSRTAESARQPDKK